ncbi:RIP metalloprotease RseP, partial [Candidatus Shapirobacteria bacterium]|nr:RIP metalloprotease RseP [Candidatus Shapirobacteria bacterium]
FVINLFPMPPLDGGKLLFIGIEAVFGKRLAPKVERWAQNVGMILLVILIVLITINDISRLFSNSLL